MQKIIGATCSGINHLSWFFQVVAEISLVGLLLLVCVEVVSRDIFKSPSTVSIELCEYSLIILTFLSAGWVMRKGRHINVETLWNILPKKTQLSLDTVSAVLVIIYCAILAWKGGQNALMAYMSDYHSSSVLGFPLWIPYACIPIGGWILGLQSIVVIGEKLGILKVAVDKQKGMKHGS